ncbi:MAG: hypothetical protein AAB874_03565 [Patescibacteria group bacterium]
MIDVAAHINGFSEYHEIPVIMGTQEGIARILGDIYPSSSGLQLCDLTLGS